MKQEVLVPDMDVALELNKLSAQIVTELATGLVDAETVRTRYGISPTQWEVLARNPVFRNMLKEAIQNWRGEINASKRITLKSEVALEDSVHVLYGIAHNPEVAPLARIEAIKQMESLTGRKQKDANTGPTGGGFVLNINLAGGRQGVTIEGQSLPPAND